MQISVPSAKSIFHWSRLGLMGIISPYATGPGPIYYGSGYVSRKDFWTLGLIFGGIYLAVLLLVVPYLRYYLG